MIYFKQLKDKKKMVVGSFLEDEYCNGTGLSNYEGRSFMEVELALLLSILINA